MSGTTIPSLCATSECPNSCKSTQKNSATMMMDVVSAPRTPPDP